MKRIWIWTLDEENGHKLYLLFLLVIPSVTLSCVSCYSDSTLTLPVSLSDIKTLITPRSEERGQTALHLLALIKPPKSFTQSSNFLSQGRQWLEKMIGVGVSPAIFSHSLFPSCHCRSLQAHKHGNTSARQVHKKSNRHSAFKWWLTKILKKKKISLRPIHFYV